MSLLDFISKKKKYDVVVFKQRENGYVVELDTAVSTKIEGHPAFVKTKPPRNIPWDATKYMTANDVIILEEDMNGSLGPCSFKPGEIIGISTNVQDWATENIVDSIKQWENPNFFQKWGIFLMTGGALLFVGMFYFIVLPLMLPYAQIAPGAAQALATGTENLVSSTNQLTTAVQQMIGHCVV